MANKLDYTSPETKTTNMAALEYVGLHRNMDPDESHTTLNFTVEARFSLWNDDGGGTVTRTGTMSFNSAREVGEVSAAALTSALPSAPTLESEIIDWMLSNGFLPAGTKS